MQINNRFSNIISKILGLIFILITGYLLITSLFSTVYISEYENIYYIKDNFIFNIVFLIIISFVFYVLRDKVSKITDGNEYKMIIFNSVILSAILLIFVLSTRLYPLYDQAKIINTVKNLCVNDYSDFLPGGYMDRYDVQWGVMLFYYLLTKMTGRICITLIQVINVICIVTGNYIIFKIFEIISNRKTATFIHLAMCCYIPQWFYSSFVYGTIPSFFFGTIALYFFIYYKNIESNPADLMKENNNLSEKKMHGSSLFYIRNKAIIKIAIYNIFTAVSISLSILFKTNSIITMLAIIMLCCFYTVSEKRKRYIVLVVSMVVIYIFSSKAVNSYVNSKTELKCQGMPRTGHIAMALMENDSKGPGWYNGFNYDIYTENDFDKEKTDVRAKESIKESLIGFKNNPANFISFITRKIISQWNEPTYESLYIMYGRDSLVNMPLWFKTISNPTSSVNRSIFEIMNLMQLLILFGSFLYFIINFKCNTVDNLIPGIVVLGGFFFHLFWEAKSQYIFVYIILLIPYAVLGIKSFVRKAVKIEGIKSQKKISKELLKNSNLYIAIGFITLCIIIFLSDEMSSIGKIFKPGWKTEEYKEVVNPEYNNYTVADTIDPLYKAALKMPVIKTMPGRYYISLSDNQDMVLSPVKGDTEDEEIGFYSASTSEFDRRVILFENYSGKMNIRFQKTQNVMDIANGEIRAGSPVKQWKYNGDPGQCFEFVTIDNENVIIKCDAFYLGLNSDNKVFLTDRENAVKVKISKAD